MSRARLSRGISRKTRTSDSTEVNDFANDENLLSLNIQILNENFNVTAELPNHLTRRFFPWTGGRFPEEEKNSGCDVITITLHVISG